MKVLRYRWLPVPRYCNLCCSGYDNKNIFGVPSWWRITCGASLFDGLSIVFWWTLSGLGFGRIQKRLGIIPAHYLFRSLTLLSLKNYMFLQFADDWAGRLKKRPCARRLVDPEFSTLPSETGPWPRFDLLWLQGIGWLYYLPHVLALLYNRCLASPSPPSCMEFLSDRTEVTRV